MGLINFSVPKEELVDKTIELAQKLMAKSPNVLRATKHAVRQVRTMDFDQSYDYLAAKGQALKVGDAKDSYNRGLSQFLDKKSYKPTFEPFTLKKTTTKSAKKATSKRKRWQLIFVNETDPISMGSVLANHLNLSGYGSYIYCTNTLAVRLHHQGIYLNISQPCPVF